MAASDLTTLANVKAWLGVSNGTQDAILSRLISAASAQIRTITNRYNFYTATVTEVRDGTDTRDLVLMNWPVLSVSSVIINNAVVEKGSYSGEYNLQTAGWFLQPYDGFAPGIPQKISLLNWSFLRGKQNIRVTYTYGYQAQETTTITFEPYTVEALQGSWMGDVSVTDAVSGVAYTLCDGNPSHLQYFIVGGMYIFSQDDYGSVVNINYNYVPYDLEQACIDLVAYKQVQATRIGIRSKSLLGKESVAYDPSGIPDTIMAALEPYINRMIL